MESIDENNDKNKYKLLDDSSTIKRCFIPTCQNNILNSPKKLFFRLPKCDKTRALWFQAVSRNDLKKFGFCCEDHFNLQIDSRLVHENKDSGLLIKLNNNAIPSRNLGRKTNFKEVEGIFGNKNSQEKKDLNKKVPINFPLIQIENENEIYIQEMNFINDEFENIDEESNSAIEYEDKFEEEDPLNIQNEENQRNSEIFSRIHQEHIEFAENYICNICNKSFPERKTLSTHMTIHSKCYKCSKCSKSFFTYFQLKNHSYCHKVFKCDACDISFTQKQDFQKHSRLHVAAKPFGCSFCKKTFRQKYQLFQHLLTHSDGKIL